MGAADEIRFGTDGWRAVIAEDFTYENLRRVADAAGRVFAEDAPGGRIIVGLRHPLRGRRSLGLPPRCSPSTGSTCVVSDRYLPTPALCWSVARDEAAVGGVMLTASHNPSPYLGFKLRMADGGASPVSFTDRIEAALAPRPLLTVAASTRSSTSSARTSRRCAGWWMSEAIRSAGLTRGGRPALRRGAELPGRDAALARASRSTEIHDALNPGFGGLHPEPIPPHIDEVRELVRTAGLDAGIHHRRRCRPHRRRGRARRLREPAPHHLPGRPSPGRGQGHERRSRQDAVDLRARRPALRAPRPRVVTTPVGFKWIYEEMVEGDVLIGGEESGGIGIPSHVRERDGLLMALLLTEMMAQRGKGLGELVDDLLAVTGPMEYTAQRPASSTPQVKDAFLARVPDDGARRDRRARRARHHRVPTASSSCCPTTRGCCCAPRAPSRSCASMPRRRTWASSTT